MSVALSEVLDTLEAPRAPRCGAKKRGTDPMRATAFTTAATAAALLVTPAASAASPAERETFELQCDGGRELVVAVNSGNGAFTPARVVGTRQMFIPIEFGDFYFIATSPEGEVLAEGSEPGDTKGAVSKRNPRPMLTCAFEETEVLAEDDPEFGLPAGTTITFGGEVTGFLTGR